MIGVGVGKTPSARLRSEWQTPQWVTRTRTWPARGGSISISLHSASGRPAASSTAALILRGSFVVGSLNKRNATLRQAPITRVDLLPRLGVHVNAARYPNICRWFEADAARPSVPESSHS